MSKKVGLSDDKKKEYAGRLLGGIIAFGISRIGVSEDTAKSIGGEIGNFFSGAEIKESNADTVEKHWNEALDRMWNKVKKRIDLPIDFWAPLEESMFQDPETLMMFLDYLDKPSAETNASDSAKGLRLIIQELYKDSNIIDTTTIPDNSVSIILETLEEEIKNDISLYNYIQHSILRMRLAKNGILGNPREVLPDSLAATVPIVGLIESNDNSRKTVQADKSDINKINRERAVEHERNTPVINIFRERMTWSILIENELYRPQQFVMKRAYTKIQDVDELLKQYGQSNLMITGDAGYGKTAALEYVFLKHGLDDELPVYYLPAYVFTRGKDNITHLQKAIRNLIEGRGKLEGLLLIDGFEEAYLNNYAEATSVIRMIADSGTVFWIACRPDFYDNLDSEIDGYIKNIAHVKKWERDDFYGFVSKYEQYYRMTGLADRIDNLTNNSVMETSSIYRPLYAMLFLYLATEELEEGNEEYVIKNEYDLIEQFIKLWFKRESKRNKKEYCIDDYLPELRRLAINVYEHKRPRLEDNESVIRGLVVVNKRSGRPLVDKFCHREFCIYFIAESIIDGIQKGDVDLINCFSHLYYDDVTNLCKVALGTCSLYTPKMYNNMFSIYKQTYEPNEAFVSPKAKSIISKYNELQLLSLRDEIIYYIMRLPNVVSICKGFVDYAIVHINDNIMISRSLAYSLATIMPHPHILEFARKIKPGSPEELRNRSWALVFYGDVPGYDEFAGYTYEDDGTSKWTNVKKIRWSRLSTNKPSFYRTRILDIPSLYCFYVSRNFKDCNSYEDLVEIANCDITNYIYSDEERKFLIEQKRILLEAYRENLLKNAEIN